MIEGFRYKTYDERLHETGLTTLVQRRKRGDLIETFMLVKGITKVDHEIFFTINENIGRGNMCNNKFIIRISLPQMPKVFRQPKTPKGGGCNPPGFLPSRPNFLKIFLMGMFSGSRNPTVIMKKFYLYCMTLKIKVKHLFAWPFLSPVVNMIQSRSWCRF